MYWHLWCVYLALASLLDPRTVSSTEGYDALLFNVSKFNYNLGAKSLPLYVRRLRNSVTSLRLAILANSELFIFGRIETTNLVPILRHISLNINEYPSVRLIFLAV